MGVSGNMSRIQASFSPLSLVISSGYSVFFYSTYKGSFAEDCNFCYLSFFKELESSRFFFSEMSSLQGLLHQVSDTHYKPFKGEAAACFVCVCVCFFSTLFVPCFLVHFPFVSSISYFL